MKLRDCRMDRIGSMTNFPITWSIPVWGRETLETRATTIAQRLAFLITRIETMQRPSNAIGSKWYLQHLAEISLPDRLKQVLEPFVTRLREDVRRVEERFGTVDPMDFDRRVEFAGATRQEILYGPPAPHASMGPASGTPRRDLETFISTWMWRQGLYD